MDTIDSAVILAGGLGSRLKGVVNDRPKPLADVAGRPFLFYLLENLESFGVRDVVLGVGHMAGLIERTVGDAHRSVSVTYSREEVPMGTAGALGLAERFIAGSDFFMLNGDSFCDVNLSRLAAAHRKAGAVCTMTLTAVEDVSRYGSVTCADDGAVTSFREKGGRVEQGLVNAGVYAFSGSVFDLLPSDGPSSMERDILPRLIGNGLFGFFHEGRFIDIGTPQSYQEAQDLFAEFQVQLN